MLRSHLADMPIPGLTREEVENPLLEPLYPDYSNPDVLAAIEATHAAQTKAQLITGLQQSIQHCRERVEATQYNASQATPDPKFSGVSLEELEREFDKRFEKLNREQAFLDRHDILMNIGAIYSHLIFAIGLGITITAIATPVLGVIMIGVGALGAIPLTVMHQRREFVIDNQIRHVIKFQRQIRYHKEKQEHDYYKERLDVCEATLAAVKAQDIQPAPAVASKTKSPSSVSHSATLFGDRRKVKRRVKRVEPSTVHESTIRAAGVNRRSF